MTGPLEIGDLPTVLVNQEASFEPVREAILELREKVEDLCNQELTKINKQGPQTGVFFPHLPSIRSQIVSIFLLVSLAVNDTTVFTLGDCKSGTFF